MDETTFQIIRSCAFVLSFALVFAVQSVTPYRRAARPAAGNWPQNLPLALLNTTILSLVCGACLCTAARYAEERSFGLFRVSAAPLWAAAAGTIVALDFVLWAWHRANHQIQWLWRFHRVHHSDIDFDISTSLRFHTVELLLSLPLKLATVLALGAPLSGILLFEGLFGVFNMFVHGNIRLAAAWEPRLSRLLILPAVHRRHHSIRADEQGRNFGTILSVWDRWMGTWAGGSSADQVTTGLPDLAGSGRLSFLRCLTLPFQPAAARAVRPRP